MLKELDKGVHKGVFNKPIETPADTTKLASTINTSAGVMSSYAPTGRYKEAKLKFDNTVNEMNQVALGLQIIQDDYSSTKKSYLEDEERMRILVEDEYKDYPTGSYFIGGPGYAFAKVADKNPELHQRLKLNKRKLISLDSKLGYKEHGMAGSATVYQKQNVDTPFEDQLPFNQYNIKERAMLKALKELNIFEGDSAKTVLPEEFLNNAGYNTLTLEEE